ncbi:MAG: hypothetical protein AAGA36_05825 [Pseudomonadota bacterium]
MRARISSLAHSQIAAAQNGFDRCKRFRNHTSQAGALQKEEVKALIYLKNKKGCAVKNYAARKRSFGEDRLSAGKTMASVHSSKTIATQKEHLHRCD